MTRFGLVLMPWLMNSTGFVFRRTDKASTKFYSCPQHVGDRRNRLRLLFDSCQKLFDYFSGCVARSRQERSDQGDGVCSRVKN